MNDTHDKRAEQLKVSISLNSETHHFISHGTTTTLKEKTLRVNASQTAFSPFRIYTLEINIANDSPKGTYLLDGDLHNPNRILYVPPFTNLLNLYRDTQGFIELTATATKNHVNGTFNCTAKSVNPAITDEATLDNGEVSFSQASHPHSNGHLRGKIDPGDYSFNSTTLFMSLVEPEGHPHYLEVLAVDDSHGGQRVYLHIPTSKLGESSLPITTTEDGNSALATLLFTGVHRATSGTVSYEYDKNLQKLKGKLNFKAIAQDSEYIIFSGGTFEITGLTPAPGK